MFESVLPHIFLGSAQRRLFRRGAPVFVYHHVAKPPEACTDPFLYVEPAAFRQQLGQLHLAGYSTVGLDALTAPAPPQQRVVLTFDDGLANVFQNAMEPLAEYGFTATQFLVADLIGKQNAWDTKHGAAPEALMDVFQIREWLAAGHAIGSHTLTHRNLTRLSLAEAREQIAGSKKKLEDLFQIEIRHFCYPHGRWNEALRNLVGEAGYHTACTTAFGVNTADTHPMALHRIAPLSERELGIKTLHRIKGRLGKKLRLR